MGGQRSEFHCLPPATCLTFLFLLLFVPCICFRKSDQRSCKMEGLIPYVFKAVTRHKNRRYYENLYGQTSPDASFLDSEHKWEGKRQQQQQSHRHRRTMSLPSCLGQQHQIPVPAIMEQEKEEEENMKGCVGGGVIIFMKGGSKSLRLPGPNRRS